MFLLFVLSYLFLVDWTKQLQEIIMVLGGQHVNNMLSFIWVSEMSVFSQVSFFNELFEKSKGGKRKWASPMGSKQ